MNPFAGAWSSTSIDSRRVTTKKRCALEISALFAYRMIYLLYRYVALEKSTVSKTSTLTPNIAKMALDFRIPIVIPITAIGSKCMTSTARALV